MSQPFFTEHAEERHLADLMIAYQGGDAGAFEKLYASLADEVRDSRGPRRIERNSRGAHPRRAGKDGDRCRPAGGQYITLRQFLPNFAILPTLPHMSTMNISLPDSLKAFVDEQVARRGYGTSSEYVRELIRRDHDRTQLRGLLIEGAASAPGTEVGVNYYNSLRRNVRKRARK